MIIIESIKLALAAIWTHKARSFLTMLGIIIGISSVITLMSIGEGVKYDVKSTIKGLGSNFVFVIPGNIDLTSGNRQGQGDTSSGFGNPANLISGNVLTREDINNIKDIDGVETAAAMNIVSGVLKADDKISSPMIVGIENDFQNILTGIKLEKGRFFTNDDLDQKVIILSDGTVQQLFGNSDVLGKKVSISAQIDKKNQDVGFEIIGVLAPPTSSSIFSTDFDNMTLITFKTSQIFSDGEEKIFRVGVKISDSQEVKDISQKIKDKLLENHKEGEVSVVTQDDILGLLGDVLNLLTTFIAAIAAISLVVGGVGIMNIMLVSVTERTREIGLRKAVGATNSAILLQFLIESVIISIVGGLISLGTVRIATWIIQLKTDINPVITPESIILAIGVCLAIGVVFGLAPAVQAARKNPIEALRYE